MPSTCAERQRKRREKLKTDGKFAEYRQKETDYHKQWEAKRKSKMNNNQKTEQRAFERERKRRYRQKLREQARNLPSCDETAESPQMHPNILARALNRVESRLPQSPRKRSKVVQKLALRFSPSMFTPPKRRRADALSTDVIKQVVDFYESDDISSQAPGKNDFVIIRDGSKKTKVQKRYLLLTLGEAYQRLKELHPNLNIGKSRFAEIRPRHVCLRADTPANVCLCSYHENVRLILVSLPDLPNSTSDLITKIVCDETSEACMHQSCEECKDLKKFDDLIENADINMSSQVTIKQWAKTGEKLARTSKKDTVKNVLDLLRSKLTYFLKHVYIKRVQAAHFKHLKEDLAPGTALDHIDFSENFTHPIQDEIQSAYWDTPSSTLYTAMVYFRSQPTAANDQGTATLHSVPFVIVSDYKNHDKYAVSVFNNEILKKLEERFGPVQAIEYQSDGAAQHFKQKFTLCAMTLTGKPTTWHFSATSHGKGCIDGIGGTVKRRVAEVVRAGQQDLDTSKTFAELASQVCPNITVIYVAKEDVEASKATLEAMWMPNDQDIKGLPGTRDHHCFQSVRPYVLRYATTSEMVTSKLFSFTDGSLQYYDTAEDSTDQDLSRVDEEITSTQAPVTTFAVGQWVDVSYETVTYHGLIIDEKDNQYRIQCLEKTGRGKGYRFEGERDAIWYVSTSIKGLMEKVPTLVNARGLYNL